MDMMSRIGLALSVVLCAGAGYLFFQPSAQSSAQDASTTQGDVQYEVREIEVPAPRDETLAGQVIEQRDPNHTFLFDADARTYAELYGKQHIGEGAYQTFEGHQQPHFLKPLKLAIESNKEYLFLEGISENRVYEIVNNSEQSLELKTLQGEDVRFVKP